MSKLIAFGLATSVLATSSVALNANASTAYLFGGRSIGMGGADVAQADDSTAILKNPAGMGMHALGQSEGEPAGGDISLTYGSVLQPQDGQWNVDSNQITFIGGMYGGMGAAYGCDMAHMQTTEGSSYKVCTFSAGYGLLLSDWISIGGSLGFPSANNGDGHQQTSSKSIDGTLGVILVPLNQEAELTSLEASTYYTLRLGAAYSTEADDKLESGELVALRPERFGVGAHFSGAVATSAGIDWRFTLNGEYERLSYLPSWGAPSGEVDIVKFGGEWKLVSLFGSGVDVAFRYGENHYLSFGAGDKPEREQFYGIGLLGKHHGLDFSANELQNVHMKGWGYTATYSFYW
ncbi:hypothetical protein [uncultured Shewanella sp.]|uniref:hypothetical protein n=1 Tax=uncultured Shewanella sp. TaxID=173975 RepID=UPI002634EA50|nr:hypothetical protein [uncultured Shewanella sp.]